MIADQGRRRHLAGLLAGGGAALLAACATDGPSTPAPGWREVALPDDEQPPPAPRELRAAWVASVANIDWPSRPGLAAAQWRTEALAMMDRAAAIGLNALILQIRPMADALYASALEPWSEYFSGASGQAPDGVQGVDGAVAGGQDPLAFWVEQAHRRGLELHAWFNPYRARHASARSALDARHVARRRPDLVRRYGDQLWLDPAEPEAAALTRDVVLDVVRRHDIDAVHIDDYFYPYPVSEGGVEQPFPDDGPWQRYRDGGGLASRADWRRAQVDGLVALLWHEIAAAKPWVRFGISPFGLPRPDLRPPGISGFSQYDKLYADVERWCEQGWFDYLAPQLYWPRERRAQAFEVLLDHWLQRNAGHGRHVWPGLFTSSIAQGTAKPPWTSDELLAQIALQRQRHAQQPQPQPAAGGHIHFSMVALMQDRDGIATRLQREAYAMPALVPATPWRAGVAPPAAVRLLRGAEGGLALQTASGEAAWQWVLWQRRGRDWHLALLPGQTAALPDAVAATADLLVVSAVNRLGQEGPRRAWLRPG